MVVVESYVHAFISMLVTNTLYLIIRGDYDVQLASWGDDLGGDLVSHASRSLEHCMHLLLEESCHK